MQAIFKHRRGWLCGEGEGRVMEEGGRMEDGLGLMERRLR